jgi:hypothetical protein
MAKAAPLSLAELLRLLPRIQSTLELLVGEGQARARSRGGSDLGAELLALMNRKKGLSLGELVEASGAGRGAVKYHLRALRREKKAKLVGDRKTAKWFSA